MIRTARSGGRTLKTATAVLQVMKFMATCPRGVEPAQVARHFERSETTARYLLNSLCEEGFATQHADGQFHLRTTTHEQVFRTPPDAADLPEATYLEAVEELYQLTGQRAYLISVEDRALVVQEARGRQGLPTMPGLGVVIREEAHAVAVGKVVLASSPGASVAAYIECCGLPAYTHHTVTSREGLASQMSSIERLGYGVDREEFATGFSCIAAPLFDADGAVRGALGLSTTAGRFIEHRGHFTSTVRDIARTASSIALNRDRTPEAV